MALSQREIELDAERLDLVHQIEALKVKCRAVKKERDDITRFRTLEHKVGGFSDEDKAALKRLM